MFREKSKDADGFARGRIFRQEKETINEGFFKADKFRRHEIDHLNGNPRWCWSVWDTELGKYADSFTARRFDFEQYLLGKISQGAKKVLDVGVGTGSQWLEFLREFSEDRTLVFEQCCADFINQVNLIPDLVGTATITSFHADFFCPSCDAESKRLFKVSEGLVAIRKQCENQKCTECKETMELEADPDLYLRFLKRCEEQALRKTGT